MSTSPAGGPKGLRYVLLATILPLFVAQALRPASAQAPSIPNVQLGPGLREVPDYRAVAVDAPPPTVSEIRGQRPAASRQRLWFLTSGLWPLTSDL